MPVERAAPAADFLVDVSHDIAPFLARCAALSDGTTSPFHSVAWLRAWYETLGTDGGRQPLLVGVRSARTGADLLLLPLTRRRAGGLSLVEFADASVVDYPSPLFAPGAAAALADAAEACRLWRAVRQALAGHDLLRIEKMPTRALDEAGAQPNPLMRALRSTESEMCGNQLHIGGSWDDWLASLSSHRRREFNRSWRVFTRSPQARFERITEASEAQQVLEQLEAQQRQILGGLGTAYRLDQPAFRAFYRAALAGGLADGTVVLTALRDGERVAAAQIGIANGQRYIALRMSNGGQTWSACSPGRLLLERTARHLHEQGLRWFDFGIGDYAHKEMFQVSRIELFDAVDAISWRGVPMVWAYRARHALKRQAWVVRMVRRVLARPGSP